MKTRCRAIVLALVATGAIGMSLFFVVYRSSRLYRATVLPSLGGNLMAAFALNDCGQVVGIATTKSGERHLFLWDRVHGTQDLGPAEGWFDINNAGQIAGVESDSNGNRQAFLWEPGTGRTPLGTLGGKTSRISAINNRGQIVGTSQTAGGVDRPFLWDRVRGMQDLSTLIGAHSFALVYAHAINDAGAVLGVMPTSSRQSQYFIWDPNGGMITIGPLPSGKWLWELNNNSWTVGQANDVPPGRRMVGWNRSTGVRDLFPLDLPLHESVAHLNDANQIVYCERSATRPSWIRRTFFAPYTPCWLWDPHRGKILLNPYIPMGAKEFFVPSGINNRGCIVGTVDSRKKVPRVRAILLEPIPKRWGR